jgi:diaminohydroxyphosphoribosylaminopyrimidine deaminase / 5-amino-6-(5-phosphoribosylamino)uracil reductase
LPTVTDEQWMARALELARLADHRTSPNPMVGALVLDRDGAQAGEGYHRRKGEPHAEQEALRAAGERARGGTIYTTLEPCTHAHRSPSCADAIIDAGVARAVVAVEKDPDKRVHGSGIARLRQAGLRVTVGVLERDGERLIEFYSHHRKTGRPFVTAKFAMSLDGKIATATGESRWITGEAARKHGHRLRHEHDAILIGVNTLLKDDPELSAREGERPRQPLRVILDSKLRSPATARALHGGAVVATTVDGHRDDAEVLKLPADRGRVSLEALLDELGRRDVISLLVEGGGETLASFFESGLVNKVCAYVAPIVIGGREAPTAVAGAGAARLADALRLRDVEVGMLDADVMISGYPDVQRNR